MLFIANWKMKMNVTETLTLTQALVRQARQIPPDTEVIVCPSYLSLAAVSKSLKGSRLQLGAQDCFWEQSGAFTGEISPRDLREQGCQFVILGHSERRQHLGETDEQVHRKLEAALNAGLIPVLCVGEDYAERAGHQKDYVLIRQMQGALQGVALASDQRLVVAYEPVWAISTGGVGIVATPEEVLYASEVIRHTIIDLFGAAALGRNAQIIYGGSVNPANVAEFTALKTMQGVLVGAASLNPAEFVAVMQAANRSSKQ